MRKYKEDDAFRIHNEVVKKLGKPEQVVYKVGKKSLMLCEIKENSVQLNLFETKDSDCDEGGCFL